MKNCTKKHSIQLWIATVALVAAAAQFLVAQPAYAGSWALTGTPTGSYTAGASGTGIEASYTDTSMDLTDFGILSGQALSGSFSYTGTITWVGGGTQPATVTLSETALVYGDADYSGPTTTNANDGLGDPPVTTYTTGYPGSAQSTVSQGSHTTTISVPAGKSYKFTRYFSNYAIGGLNECLVEYDVSVN